MEDFIARISIDLTGENIFEARENLIKIADEEGFKIIAIELINIAYLGDGNFQAEGYLVSISGEKTLVPQCVFKQHR